MLHSTFEESGVDSGSWMEEIVLSADEYLTEDGFFWEGIEKGFNKTGGGIWEIMTGRILFQVG